MSALDLSITVAYLVGVLLKRTRAAWVFALLGSALAALAACDPGDSPGRASVANEEASAAPAPDARGSAGAPTRAGALQVACLPDGYWATQTLQPVASLVAGGFASYWDVVTRDAAPLR